MHIVVLGGGLSGLMSALLAQSYGHTTTVLESSDRLGGLWNSREVSLGPHRLNLDEGLRLPVMSGLGAADELLFGTDTCSFEWHRFDGWTREGAISDHGFNRETSCFDIVDSVHNIDAALEELRASVADGSSANEMARISAEYGASIAQQCLAPVIEGHFGIAAEHLAPGAAVGVIPRRLVLGDRKATARYLEDESLRSHTAHACHADLPRELARTFLTPSEGGVSKWSAALAERIRQDGGEIRQNTRVTDLKRDGARVQSVVTDSREQFECDWLISSMPPPLLATALGAPSIEHLNAKFFHLAISHVFLDVTLDHDVQYALNFSTKPDFSRIVFHNNIGTSTTAGTILTFEHMLLEIPTPDLHEQIVHGALAQARAAGAVPQSAIVDYDFKVHRYFAPIPTIGYADGSESIRAHFIDSCSNLSFVGRAGGNAHFVDDIARELTSLFTEL